MKSELTKHIDELNSSNNYKIITKQGIVKELSTEFQDDNYGFIQFALIQSFKMRNQQIGVQRDINVILLEDNIGLVVLGDKVQITGIEEIYNAKNNKKRELVLVVNDIEIINNEAYNHLTQQDITNIRTIAKQPNVQKNLANYLFHNIPIEEDIKMIGMLILFCTDFLNPAMDNIHSHISLLIVGASGTYKTTYLQTLRNLLPDDNLDFSQISDVHFTTYNSRYKKGGKICKKAGLADLAKNGIILIDILEELKPYRVSFLDNDFDKILRKT